MFDVSNLPVWIAALILAIIVIAWCAFEWPDAVKAAWEKFGDLSRVSPLLLVFAITFSIVLQMNPAKAGLAIFGVSKIALGGYIGYWCDRLGFRPEDRPHRLEGISKGTAWKRRAIIIAAAIVAAALIP